MSPIDNPIPRPVATSNAKPDTKNNFVVYVFQLVMVFIVIMAAILNLSLNKGKDNKDMWLTLLCSCIGYVLPAPAFKKKVTT